MRGEVRGTALVVPSITPSTKLTLKKTATEDCLWYCRWSAPQRRSCTHVHLHGRVEDGLKFHLVHLRDTGDCLHQFPACSWVTCHLPSLQGVSSECLLSEVLLMCKKETHQDILHVLQSLLQQFVQGLCHVTHLLEVPSYRCRLLYGFPEEGHTHSLRLIADNLAGNWRENHTL